MTIKIITYMKCITKKSQGKRGGGEGGGDSSESQLIWRGSFFQESIYDLTSKCTHLRIIAGNIISRVFEIFGGH